MQPIDEFRNSLDSSQLSDLLAGKGDLSTLLGMRLGLEIEESSEKLLEIPSEALPRFDPHPYAVLGAPYGQYSPFVLREGVVARLLQAQKKLGERAEGHRLKVFDGYRPLAVQSFMVDFTFLQQASKRNLKPSELSVSEREEVMQEVFSVWARPNEDPSSPPPHSTGAAVDLTIIDSDGRELAMGGEIDQIGAVSISGHYSSAKDEAGMTYQRNRELLREVMEESGFVRLPHEWWHFSYGDQTWSLLRYLKSGKKFKAPFYGRADLVCE